MVSILTALLMLVQTATYNAELVQSAKALEANTIYDPAYVSLDYPGGDVPANRGVCTDVVIRAYRGIGVDLQVLVHEDMRANFSAYPAKRRYGQSGPDRNIDHRRVPNLDAFFKRQGASLPVTEDLGDYQPGDVVYWKIGNLDHVGILIDEKGTSGNWKVMHNMGWGQHAEDVLFTWELRGHYRFRNGE